MNKKSFPICRAFRICVFFIPVSPLFFFLIAIHSDWVRPLLGLTLISFILPILDRFENILNRLQVALCWFPILFFTYHWFLIFPELFRMIGISLLILIINFSLRPFFRIPLFFETILMILIPNLLFLLVMFISYDVSSIYVMSYLIGITGMIIIVFYLDNQKSLGLSPWSVIFILSSYSSVICLVLYVYTCDQRSLFSEIVHQKGIQSVESVEQAPDSDIPFHNISSFFVYKNNAVLFPRHLPHVIYLASGERPRYFRTDRGFADNVIFDTFNKHFYFVTGNYLYKGSLKDLSITLLHEFDPELINPPRNPNYIRGYPILNPKKVLVQFDLDNGVFVYDLEKHCEIYVRSQYFLIESIWHPDGTKIISYGADSTSISGHFVIMDLQGNLLSHRTIMPFDDISLTPTASGEFLAASFFRGKLERLSVDTLKSSWALDVQPGPRSVREVREYTLVPSYISGTLSVYRTSDKVLFGRFLIGKRVRSITPTLREYGYWISSSAGLFFIDMDKVLSF